MRSETWSRLQAVKVGHAAMASYSRGTDWSGRMADVLDMNSQRLMTPAFPDALQGF